MNKIKMQANELNVEAGMLMEELMLMIKEQYPDEDIELKTVKRNIPNTKGEVLSEIILTFGLEIAKDLTVAFIGFLAKEVISKFFSKKDVEKVTIDEVPGGIVINNSGDGNVYNISVNITQD